MLDFLLSPALAEDAAMVAGAATAPNPIISLLPMIILFVVFYFLLIRPQMKRQKEHKQMVEGLAVGDEVVTQGGALGRVVKLSDQFVQIELADGVRIFVQRPAITLVVPKGTLKTLAE